MPGLYVQNISVFVQFQVLYEDVKQKFNTKTESPDTTYTTYEGCNKNIHSHFTHTTKNT